MIYLALVQSVLLCAAAVYAVLDKKWIRLLSFLGLAAFFSVLSTQDVVVVNILVLIPVVVLLRLSKPRSLRYALPAPLLATAVVYAFGLRDSDEIVQLRKEYPFESLEGRLPPAPLSDSRRLTSATLTHLEKLEAHPYSAGVGTASVMLQRLHEDTFSWFISKPQFGVARMRREPTARNLGQQFRHKPPEPQPVPRASPADVLSGGKIDPRPMSERPFVYYHDAIVLYFVNLPSIGYFKDRQHVAGFQPHRFRPSSMLAEEQIYVETVDLIGLLRHPEPVAYVSAYLPQMDELRDAPTRPLDEFETASLKAIRDGEDLIYAERNSHVRMVGSIRNLKPCITCHDGERGDLLGAFSYTVRRGQPSNKPAGDR
jgi:hypothetical protein